MVNCSSSGSRSPSRCYRDHTNLVRFAPSIRTDVIFREGRSLARPVRLLRSIDAATTSGLFPYQKLRRAYPGTTRVRVSYLGGAMGGGTASAVEASGLDALVLLLRFHEIAADPAQIRHPFGGGAFGAAEIFRCARQFKLKARALTMDWMRLAHTPLPGLAECRDGSFVVVGKVLDDKVLIQDPQVGRP